MNAFRFCALLLLTSIVAWSATPPGLINYQGVLRDGTGAPQAGSFDMTFRFYNLVTAGTLLLTDTHNAAAPSGQVAVSNGLFTAQLGGGTITAGSEPNLAEVFRDNAAVWLEIQVGAETLTPRVRILASAYAQNAATLQGVVNISGTENVGIGTNTPGYKLDVVGNMKLVGALHDSSGDAGTSGQVLQSTGTGTDWVNQSSLSDGDWTVSGSNMYSAVSGNVGIGTSSPGAKLHVSAPTAPEIRVDNPTWSVGEKALLTFMHGTRYAGINSYLPGSSDVDLQFTTTNADTPATAMVLTGNGDLGIGTTAPGGRLVVSEADCLEDQSSILDDSGIGTWSMWQAFKPAVDGYLCRICLNYHGGEYFSFELLTGVGTAGTRLVFLDHLTPGATITTITLPTPVRLTPEASYTFAILNSGHQGYFQAGSGDPYPRGSSSIAGDFVFTTYMTYNLSGEPTLFAHGGLVGLGTDAPSSRLSVNGDLEVSGSRLHVGTNGRVGIGTNEPANRLDVEGGAAIGAAYSGTAAAPANGLIVEGNAGIGTNAPNLPLTVQGSGTASQLIQFKDSSGANQWHLNLQGSGLNLSESAVADYRLFVKEGGNVGIGTGTPGYQLQLSTDSAAKLSTMAWTVWSDARLKRDIRPFTDGLEMLARVHPVRYRLNGLAGLPAGHEGIGVIAQEIMAIAPYTVGISRARLHPADASETELYDFNGSALVFALINAVQELDARTQELADRKATGVVSRTLDAEPRRFEDRDELSKTGPVPLDASGTAGRSGPVVQTLPAVTGIEPGDVLVLNPANGDELYPCNLPADPMVVGIALEESETSDVRREMEGRDLSPLTSHWSWWAG